MSRPEGQPTHWMPLWHDDSGAFVDVTDDVVLWAYADLAMLGIIPADRVTIAPEPWAPKAGDRVRTKTGGEVTIITTEPINGKLACVWHGVATDEYSSVLVALIEGPA